MPRTIRFHLDENVDPAIATGLKRYGIDVTTSIDAGLLRAPDEQQVAYGILSGRVIFTQDKDFLRIHATGTPHAGIGYCHRKSRTIGQIIDGLVLIWELLERDEMENRVEFL
jgi:predicted nuclease of predicted toxin-antitoxin system